MKRFSEQFKKQAASISMRADEKRELRERLAAYVEYHPLPEGQRPDSGATTTPVLETEAFRYVRVDGWRIARWAGMAVAVLVIAVPMLAERAMPGDVLYAVKVRVNEEVRSSLARTPYEKVVWETERLNRRLAEARLLANEGRLTEEVESEMADAVRTHRENAEREIEELKATDADEAAIASIQLDTTLDVQSASLRNQSESADETESDTSDGRGVATLRLAELIEAARSDDGEAPLPSYERLMAQVEQDTTRAQELLSTIKPVATEEEQRDIERRLADIERSFAAVVAATNTPDRAATATAIAVATATGSATSASAATATATTATAELDRERDAERRQLLDILRRTQRLIVFMTNIDVRSSVEIDELVPVVPTDEERTAALNNSVATTEAALAELVPLQEVITEPAEREKYSIAIDAARTELGKATSALATAKLDTAETAAAAAAEVVDDMHGIVDEYLSSPTTTEPETADPADAADPAAETTDAPEAGEAESATEEPTGDQETEAETEAEEADVDTETDPATAPSGEEDTDETADESGGDQTALDANGAGDELAAPSASPTAATTGTDTQ